MTLIYNTETAQFPTNYQYYDDIAVKTQQLDLSANETERVTNQFNFSSNALPDSFVLTQDIILTSISISCDCVIGGVVSIQANIDGNLIVNMTSTGGTGVKIIPIPSWKLYAGQELSFTVGGAGNASGEFIGYLL